MDRWIFLQFNKHNFKPLFSRCINIYIYILSIQRNYNGRTKYYFLLHGIKKLLSINWSHRCVRMMDNEYISLSSSVRNLIVSTNLNPSNITISRMPEQCKHKLNDLISRFVRLKSCNWTITRHYEMQLHSSVGWRYRASVSLTLFSI